VREWTSRSLEDMTKLLVTGADGFGRQGTVPQATASRLRSSRGPLEWCAWPALQAATPGLSEFAILGIWVQTRNSMAP